MSPENRWPYIVYELPTSEAKRKTQYHYNVLDMRNRTGQRTIARFKSKIDAGWFADVANEKFKRRSEAMKSK